MVAPFRFSVSEAVTAFQCGRQKQFENDSVGGRHFVRFRGENVVFKFIGTVPQLK